MASPLNTVDQPAQLATTEDKFLKIEQNEYDKTLFTYSWNTKEITESTADKRKEHRVRVDFFQGQVRTTKEATLKFTGSKWKLAITNSSFFTRESSIVRDGLDHFNRQINRQLNPLFLASVHP